MPLFSSARKTNSKGRAGLDRGWKLVLFTVAVSALLITALTVPFLPAAVGPEVRVGFPAPYPIKSPVTTRYVSKILTEADREAAAGEVADVYRFDSSITVQARQTLSNTLQVIAAILFDAGLEQSDRQERLESLEGVDLATETLGLLLVLNESDWLPLEREALRIYDVVTYDPVNTGGVRQIREQDVEAIRLTLVRRVQPTFPTWKRTLVADLVGQFVQPNYVVDEEETERRREEARARTAERYAQVLEGELIAYEGQIVQDIHLEKMQAAGLRQPAASWWDIVGQAALVLSLISAFSLFLYRFQEKLGQDARDLFLIGVVLVVMAVGAKFLVPGRVGFAYAYPMPTAAIWLTLLLGPQVALGAMVVLSILLGVVAGGSLELAVMGFLGGLIGIVAIWKAQRSSAFLFAGFYIAVTNLVLVGAFRLISHNLNLSDLLTVALACTINGFVSVALSFATYGLLGTLFGRVTVLQLMELSNPNHPLLHRLMQEAPGTYYHSIIVGNLAERAAEVVGADPLLVRVGAYYHDIGKVIRPYFFIDNQSGRTNIHDELPPRTSAQIITDHVRDGLVLARKYRLPEQIVQFIPQHHGTRMATYFYRRALQEDETVNPDDYRYPGPKPQSREAAILMLADSVEATVRSLDQSGELKKLLESGQGEDEDPLDKLVAGIIEERVREGQMEDSDLTFRDLKVIRKAFVDMLRGVYHPRVVYPQMRKAQEGAS